MKKKYTYKKLEEVGERLIVVDWVMNTLCNFRCEYCSIYSTKEHPQVGKMTNKETIQFFDKHNSMWHIHLSGGEPFFYPNFIDLCEQLTTNYYIDINTNLSSPDVYKFAETIDPKKVLFMNIGLHIIEREKSNRVDDLVKKCQFLIEKGFKIYLNYVMYPSLFDRFEKDYDFFSSKDLIVVPKSLRGRFFNKNYPESYSKEEVKSFVSFSKKAIVEYEKLFEGLERPLIDLALDVKFVQSGIPTPKGSLCFTGQNFIRILPDGTITRCDWNRTILGNIYKNELKLFDEPTVCNTSSCPYFCMKFSSKYNNKKLIKQKSTQMLGRMSIGVYK